MAKKPTRPAMKEVNKKPEMGKMPNKMEMQMMGKTVGQKKGAGKKGGKGC